MPFTFDPKRSFEVTDGNSRFYRSGKYTDNKTAIFVYEGEHFSVEFEARVTSKRGFFRFKGQQRERNFDSCGYIVEPELRRDFVKAFRSFAGRDPDADDYQKFRKLIVDAMTCLYIGRSSSNACFPDSEFPPAEFSVKFVHRFTEFPQN